MLLAANLAPATEVAFPREATRAALAEALYELADFHSGRWPGQPGDRLETLTVLEERLRDAACLLAREARRGRHGDAGEGPRGPARQSWVAEVQRKLRETADVSTLGLVDEEAGCFYRIAALLDELPIK